VGQQRGSCWLKVGRVEQRRPVFLDGSHDREPVVVVVVILGNVVKPAGLSKSCVTRAAFPQVVPGRAFGDNFSSVDGSLILLLVGDWLARSKVGVSRKSRIREHLDATWQVLADVEARGALAVVPIKSVRSTLRMKAST
jgi:hypothetical protein